MNPKNEDEIVTAAADEARIPDAQSDLETDAEAGEREPLGPAEESAPPAISKQKKRRLANWFGTRAKRVVTTLYESRADDIEERARRAVGSAYKDSAGDIEARAIRAIREAIRHEGDRIKEAIEHGVEVKKREVRLSLVVLVAASLVYLLLYWITSSGGAK